MPQKTFNIYFDNAAGLEPGAPVLLAGRKIGRVRKLHSPGAGEGSARPRRWRRSSKCRWRASAAIFKKVKARMTQPSMLGKPVIDFTSGEEASGLAQDGAYFIGERTGASPTPCPPVLEKLDPVLPKVTATLDSLQKTADNLTESPRKAPTCPWHWRSSGNSARISTNSAAPAARCSNSLRNFEIDDQREGQTRRGFGSHCHHHRSRKRSQRRPSPIAKNSRPSFRANKDIDLTLRNFRQASETLDRKIGGLAANSPRWPQISHKPATR